MLIPIGQRAAEIMHCEKLEPPEAAGVCRVRATSIMLLHLARMRTHTAPVHRRYVSAAVSNSSGLLYLKQTANAARLDLDVS